MSFCCFCISDEPIEDVTGRRRSYFAGSGRSVFRTDMMGAPFADMPYSLCWCMGQYCPLTMGCTQYALRKKILRDNMSQYQCFQGYYNICCIRGGTCQEEKCPDFCLFMEGCCCNCIAVSASRTYVMEKYNLSSDACDYRLIRINNGLQCLAVICDLAASFDKSLRKLANMIDCIADTFYHTVSGCMTAQVAHEENVQQSYNNSTSFSSGSQYELCSTNNNHGTVYADALEGNEPPPQWTVMNTHTSRGAPGQQAITNNRGYASFQNSTPPVPSAPPIHYDNAAKYEYH